MAVRNVTWFGLALVVLLPARSSRVSSAAARAAASRPRQHAACRDHGGAGAADRRSRCSAGPSSWFTSTYPAKAIPTLRTLIAHDPGVHDPRRCPLRRLADLAGPAVVQWPGRLRHQLRAADPTQLTAIADLAASTPAPGIWSTSSGSGCCIPATTASTGPCLHRPEVRVVSRSKSVIIALNGVERARDRRPARSGRRDHSTATGRPLDPRVRQRSRAGADRVLLATVPLLFMAVLMWSVVHGRFAALDFRYAYWSAGHRVLTGTSPYLWTAAQFRRGFAFVYPALSAVMFAPTTLLSRSAGAVIFTLLSALRGSRDAGAAARAGLARIRGGAGLAAGVRRLADGERVAVHGPGTAAVWRWRERPGIAGFLTAAMISLKPIIWPLALWLLVTRRWRRLGARPRVGRGAEPRWPGRSSASARSALPARRAAPTRRPLADGLRCPGTARSPRRGTQRGDRRDAHRHGRAARRAASQRPRADATRSRR